MVILWNLNSRTAELGDILHLSVFCVNCNVNGNFMGLEQNEKGVIALCFKCGTVKWHSCTFYFPFHLNVSYHMTCSIRIKQFALVWSSSFAHVVLYHTHQIC